MFDYEQMRKQAQNRTNQEMSEWEAVALAADTERPVLVDGRLEPRIRQADAERRWSPSITPCSFCVALQCWLTQGLPTSRLPGFKRSPSGDPLVFPWASQKTKRSNTRTPGSRQSLSCLAMCKRSQWPRD